jgi:hypothetical protein
MNLTDASEAVTQPREPSGQFNDDVLVNFSPTWGARPARRVAHLAGRQLAHLRDLRPARCNRAACCPAGLFRSSWSSSTAACCSTSPGRGCVLARARRARARRGAHDDQRPRRGAVVVGEAHQVHGLFRVVGHDAGQRLASRPGQQQQRSLADSRPPDRPQSSTGNLVSLPAEHEPHQRTP